MKLQFAVLVVAFGYPTENLRPLRRQERQDINPCLAQCEMDVKDGIYPNLNECLDEWTPEQCTETNEEIMPRIAQCEMDVEDGIYQSVPECKDAFDYNNYHINYQVHSTNYYTSTSPPMSRQ